VENKTTMGCNAKKTNKQITTTTTYLKLRVLEEQPAKTKMRGECVHMETR
jgi:hypothetical protein